MNKKAGCRQIKVSALEFASEYELQNELQNVPQYVTQNLPENVPQKLLYSSVYWIHTPTTHGEIAIGDTFAGQMQRMYFGGRPRCSGSDASAGRLRLLEQFLGSSLAVPKRVQNVLILKFWFRTSQSSDSWSVERDAAGGTRTRIL